MILMLQIFDVTANENARYKHNELEYCFECNKKQHLDNVYFRPASDIQICLLILKKAVSNFSNFGFGWLVGCFED